MHWLPTRSVAVAFLTVKNGVTRLQLEGGSGKLNLRVVHIANKDSSVLNQRPPASTVAQSELTVVASRTNKQPPLRGE